jgi:peptidoglycan/LPS O-acetylase OafA/YrhL
LPRSWFWPLVGAIVAAGALAPDAEAIGVMPVVAAGLAALAVLACVGRAPVTPDWLNLIGRRSYALYLWQYPLVLVIPDHLAVSHLITVPIGAALAWGVTCASWRLVEQPALRARLVRRPAPVAA